MGENGGKYMSPNFPVRPNYGYSKMTTAIMTMVIMTTVKNDYGNNDYDNIDYCQL